MKETKPLILNIRTEITRYSETDHKFEVKMDKGITNEEILSAIEQMIDLVNKDFSLRTVITKLLRK